MTVCPCIRVSMLNTCVCPDDDGQSHECSALRVIYICIKCVVKKRKEKLKVTWKTRVKKVTWKCKQKINGNLQTRITINSRGLPPWKASEWTARARGPASSRARARTTARTTSKCTRTVTAGRWCANRTRSRTATASSGAVSHASPEVSDEHPLDSCCCWCVISRMELYFLREGGLRKIVKNRKIVKKG